MFFAVVTMYLGCWKYDANKFTEINEKWDGNKDWCKNKAQENSKTIFALKVRFWLQKA